MVLLSSLEPPEFVGGVRNGGGIQVGIVYCPCRYWTIIAVLGGGSRCSIGTIGYVRHSTPAVCWPDPAIIPFCVGIGPLFATGGSGVAGASTATGGADPPISMVAVSLEVGVTWTYVRSSYVC